MHEAWILHFAVNVDEEEAVMADKYAVVKRRRAGGVLVRLAPTKPFRREY